MRNTPSARWLALITVLAVTLLAAGGAVAVRPALVLDVAPVFESVLTAIDPGTVVLVLGLVLVLFAPTLGLLGRLRSTPTEPLLEPDRSDETSTRTAATTRYPAPGASIDREIDRATAYDTAARADREQGRRHVVDSLRSIAAVAYARQAGVTHERAVTAIETGEWTDDVRAAAFLATEDGPSMSLGIWLYDLLRTGDPFRCSLDRTVDEIDRLQVATGDRGGDL